MKFKNIRKKFAPLVLGGVLAVASAVPVFASDSGSSLSSVETALTSSFSEVGASMTSIIGKILPIALPIIGGVLVVMLAIKIFKRVSNKA
ncbi:MAG: hypothetical protein Q4D16_21935 [Eubacteriales bacterium]|nr:hypothetical protein [Eubacteriales bacterium]